MPFKKQPRDGVKYLLPPWKGEDFLILRREEITKERKKAKLVCANGKVSSVNGIMASSSQRNIISTVTIKTYYLM